MDIILVTCNRPGEEQMEAVTRAALVEAARDHSIISVSHAPMELGYNVNLGRCEIGYWTAQLQILIGALRATSEYVAIAEADQLYPPGYFDFQPDGADVYMYDGLWILRYWDPNRFWRKEWGGWTVVCRREHLIDRLRLHLGRYRTHTLGEIFRKKRWERFSVGLPVISVKTRRQVSHTTGTTDEHADTLPYWGAASELSVKLGIVEWA